jgi:hypothetical protein
MNLSIQQNYINVSKRIFVNQNNEMKRNKTARITIEIQPRNQASQRQQCIKQAKDMS